MNYHFCRILGPAFFTGFAAVLIWTSLHNSQGNRRWLFLPGLIALVLVCFWLLVEASAGGGTVAFILALLSTVIAVVAGLWMVVTLSTWRKAAALLISIVFPMALLVSIQIGDSRSPDAITRRNGDMIVQALRSYYDAEGAYPTTLAELAPEYLTFLPLEFGTWSWFYCKDDNDFALEYVKPSSTAGWLYCATVDGFALGYVFWIDKFGYSIFAYNSETRAWESFLNSTGPFVIGPTLSPDDRWNTPPPLRRSTPMP